ncbi:hypothetical protein [Halalkalicoccus subterraneus]|uniref:hypothetical protein n=1 Tax=Halalkalicoccus subterraneus TaxID=2675002 RepID=UPI000EFCB0C3|nr:hypothetical protein [Halalkalicoccus subterraneus]
MDARNEGLVTALILAAVVLPITVLLWTGAYTGEFDPAVLLEPQLLIMLLVGVVAIAMGYRSASEG